MIDLLREQVEDTRPLALPFLPNTPRLVALTLHRRENYGRGLDLVCAAVLELLEQHRDIGVVCPVHPNPTVGHRIRRHLSGHPRISLVDPLDYRPFIAVLSQACLAITDSGGIQEEAPYLGTPVLVVRENTERPESVALGAATLVPPRTDRIVAEANRLLTATVPVRLAFTPEAAYGDGRSGDRIARVISAFSVKSLRRRCALPRRPANIRPVQQGRRMTPHLLIERCDQTARAPARLAAQR